MSHFQSMRLHHEYFDLVRCGKKRSTIRAGKRRLKEGPLRLVTNNEQLTVLVKHVDYKRMEEFTDNDAHIDGFVDLHELKKALLHFYPNLHDNSTLTIVYFELPDKENT